MPADDVRPEQSVDPTTCRCVCPGDQVPCGVECCSAGTVCLDPAEGYCRCATAPSAATPTTPASRRVRAGRCSMTRAIASRPLQLRPKNPCPPGQACAARASPHVSIC